MSYRKLLLLFSGILLALSAACMKKPVLEPETVPPSEPAWFIIDEANDRVTRISLTTWSVQADALPAANSAIMADIAVLPSVGRVYVGGGYFFGEGSSDIRGFSLTGNFAKTRFLGSAHTIPSGGLTSEGNVLYAIHYSTAGTGRYLRLDPDLNVSVQLNIGGMPQALAVRNGHVCVANIDSYAYATNWIDIIPNGTGPAQRFVITNKDPLSIALSADGGTAYVLCAGTWGNNDGFIVVITNVASATRGVKQAVPLGFNCYGKIAIANGRVFFTHWDGLYEFVPSNGTFALAALAGKSLNDIDFVDNKLYITTGWGGTEAFILNASTLAVERTLTAGGGMGAVYKP